MITFVVEPCKFKPSKNLWKFGNAYEKFEEFKLRKHNLGTHISFGELKKLESVFTPRRKMLENLLVRHKVYFCETDFYSTNKSSSVFFSHD